MARNFLGDDLVLRKRLAKMIQSRRKSVDEKQRILREKDSNPEFRRVVCGMGRPRCAQDSQTKQERQELSEQFFFFEFEDSRIILTFRTGWIIW